MMVLIDLALESFEKSKDRGLPLGNVTSQLFSNVYLNELDQFAKHVLKTKNYFRYCDDFVIIHQDRKFLENLIPKIKNFLVENLSVELHPNKIEIRKIRQGVDFLGYIQFPHATILRTSTKCRIVKKVLKAKREVGKGRKTEESFQSIITSYLGVVSHACEGKMNAWLVNKEKINFSGK